MTDRARELFKGNHLRMMARERWEYVERIEARSVVAIIAVTSDCQLILTEQYRAPVNARVLDLPAGLVGDDARHNDPKTTARLELEEETGYLCDTLELVASGPTSPGMSSEVVDLYRASGLRKSGAGGGVDGEDIVVRLAPVASLDVWMREQEAAGIRIDLKVRAALNFIIKST